MKWCRFEAGGQIRYGIVEGEARVTEDVVEIEISGIGTLRNPVVADV